MSCENSTSGALWNSGASRSENGTGMPPAARTSAACARASRNPRLRATQRSGWGIARDHAEIGAGADHHDRAAGSQSPHRPPHPSSRRSDAVRLGDVVGADHDHGGVGWRTRDEHRVDLTRKPFRRRADDRLGAQPDSVAPDSSASPRAISTPGTSSACLAAVAGGRRVAEHHQVQIERHAAVPALRRTAAGGVDAVGARRDVPRLRNDASGLVSLSAQKGAGPDVGGTRRCERGGCRKGDGRPTRCTNPHEASLLAKSGFLRVASPDQRSRCGIKSGIESVSLIVELVGDVKLSYRGWPSNEPPRALQRRRKWWR